MTIRILKDKVLETNSVFRADVLALAENGPIEAEPDPDGEYFVLFKPFHGIDHIRKDFIIAAQL